MSEQRRDNWIDIARGVGIILVVFGHALREGFYGGIVSSSGWGGSVDYVIYSFHMPLFFFLSGLNVRHSLRRGSGAFLKGKMWSIAYPYLIWSVVQGLVMMTATHSLNRPMTLARLLRIPYEPIIQFWFLYGLMLCHVLAALAPRRAVAMGIAGAGGIGFWLMPLRPDLAMTLYCLPFYMAGVHGDRAVGRWTADRRWAWLGLPALWGGFAVCVITARTGAPVAAELLRVSATTLAIGGVTLLCKLLDRRAASSLASRTLATLGVLSMTIFVLHMIVTAGARVFMLRLHVPRDPALYLGVGTAAGLLLPCAADRLFRRLGMLPWLGLAPWPGRKEGLPSGATAPAGGRR